MLRRNLTVLADHFQFHLRDGAATYIHPEQWPPTAIADRYLLPAHDGAPSCVGILAAKNYFVPVTLLVHETAPLPDADELAGWDHVVHGSLSCPSGRVTLAGGTVKEHDPVETPLVAGIWQVRLCFGNLARSADDAGADDYYRLELWRGPPRAWSVAKPWTSPDDVTEG